jgi:dipeptidyl aminopeptidase/acylaminoacyl peptidase
VARVRVPIAFTRIDRWLIALIALAIGSVVAVVRLSEPIVAPPRPRISATKHATIGLVVRARGSQLLVARAAGPAREAGLRAGDQIVAVDGLAIRSPSDIESRVAAAADGQNVEIEARRGATAVMAAVKVAVRAISPADLGLPYEDVTFRNADGLNLRGWYLPPPAEGVERAPGITYGHGNASDRRDWLDVTLAVHEAGFAQLLFDFTGRGDSDGEVITLGAHESGDLRSALDVLAARPEVDPLRLAVGGRSMGAVAALYLGGDDARVKALVLDSPFADLADVANRFIASYHLPPALLRPVLFEIAGWRAHYDPGSIKPIDAIGKIKAPILLFHGDKDDLVPFEHALRLQAAASGPVTLVPLPGLGHNSPRPASYQDRIVQFLTQTLTSSRRVP